MTKGVLSFSTFPMLSTKTTLNHNPSFLDKNSFNNIIEHYLLFVLLNNIQQINVFIFSTVTPVKGE
jgi:hypothetical protein